MNERWKQIRKLLLLLLYIAALWTRMRPHRTHLGSLVVFVFIAPLVNKHGRRLSILENRRVHGESRGQRHERLPLQGTAPQRAALRAHGPASSCSTVQWQAHRDRNQYDAHTQNTCYRVKRTNLNYRTSRWTCAELLARGVGCLCWLTSSQR